MSSETHLTAIPSAIVESVSRVTGPAFWRATAMLAAPAASTPTTRTWGIRAESAAAIPPISPPPPTGTATTSAVGTSSASSRPIVPWPATTNGSSNGGTSTAPVFLANSEAASMQSSTLSPIWITVAP